MPLAHENWKTFGAEIAVGLWLTCSGLFSHLNLINCNIYIYLNLEMGVLTVQQKLQIDTEYLSEMIAFLETASHSHLRKGKHGWKSRDSAEV